MDGASNPLLKKPNPPGQHGARRRKKSDFGLQLEEKQKTQSLLWNASRETNWLPPLKSLRRKRKYCPDFHGKARVPLRQYRLSSSLCFYNLCCSTARFSRHIMVDGKKVDRRSFLVRPWMQISVKPKSRKMKAITDHLETSSRVVPDYLELDKENFSGKLLAAPQLDQVESMLPIPINIAVVCEFLSHHH